MDVARNRIEDGPVGIREGSDTVRIDDNDLIDSRSSAIHVGGRKPAYDIDIRRNRIRGAMENGIATGFFDPEGVADGIVMGLRIVGNEIVGCVSETIASRGSDQPFGGVILGRAYDLEIHDNRIERNRSEARRVGKEGVRPGKS